MPRAPIYTLAENIRSMYNVGSLFRTGDGIRLKKLFLCGYSAYPPRDQIDKTALGATESVPWAYHKDPLSVLKKMKNDGIQVVALEHTDRSVPYTEFHYNFPVCLIVGNEVEGITQETLNFADYAVEIPMYGLKQSLNVATAYGIVLYHIFDKYQEKQKLKY
ncbi:MAG: RNA methyltransferase [Calditrichaceae bacterium]|nr:RNA methyltransferase [Calditrichaceae bacterium]MBN2709117.1 RNA methyltransferase [Calditrichaceae bacterium]RQV96228.1 MAG: TrmH family RNA methyltransferase [Calditrichota bacterium]